MSIDRLKKFIRQNYLFVILAVLSFAFHFSFLSYPSQTVFDEVHFGKFVSAYFTHEYYFDIHPPLGKLIIAGWSKLMNFNPNFGFDHIGEAATPQLFFTLRFLPALFGSLFILLFSYFAYLISRSKKTALIAGFLILFDNAFLVQSKFIFIDIFLLFFGVLTFCLFFLYQKEKSFDLKWLILLAMTGVGLGLTVSVKWTGLATLGIITFLLIAKIFLPGFALWLSPDEPAKEKKYFKRVKEAIVSFTAIVLIGFAAYTLPFYIHFDLLEKSGPGDAFMGERFKNELLQGKDNIADPMTFWQKFTELNITMYNANKNLTASHPFGSRWYEWPFDKKPIYYWVQDSLNSASQNISKIYFVGNPIIWLLALIFLTITVLRIFTEKERKKMKPFYYFLIIAFLANLLPFIFISRIAFLYHYLPAVSFGIILLSLYLRDLWPKEKIVLLAALAVIALFFIILSPLSYGWMMNPEIDKFEMKIIDFLS